MQLVFDRVESRCSRGRVVVDVESTDGIATSWRLVNEDRAVATVESVATVWRVTGERAPVRMFRHGYQSWSPSGWATLGADVDPSRTPGAIPLVIDMHHADPAVAEAGELRSELVTALVDDSDDAPVVIGFLGGDQHEGTFRLRQRGDQIELWAEAHLGGVDVPRGTARRLHPIEMWQIDDDIRRPLTWWASAAGAACSARTAAPYQVGWCSWYHYFEHVTEAAVRTNLARAGEWPFDVFQIDDGFQSAIGDWLVCNDGFGSSLETLASDIAASGYVPGLWIAPFLAAPDSLLASSNPKWIAKHDSGRPLVGMVNQHWGGAVHTLDTTQPEVLAHLETLAGSIVAAGFRYLKLDFTYAPGLAGRYVDRSQTPAQRVRAGFDAIRRGAGDDCFILGCGAPIGATIGAVDGMRIGPDVAPWWKLPDDAWAPAGYRETSPSTSGALSATRARQFMHRHLWLNDPDCLMLRNQQTSLSEAEINRWALAVGESGGMALVSDDLSLLGREQRALLDDVIAVGRAHDADATRPG